MVEFIKIINLNFTLTIKCIIKTPHKIIIEPVILLWHQLSYGPTAHTKVGVTNRRFRNLNIASGIYDAESLISHGPSVRKGNWENAELGSGGLISTTEEQVKLVPESTIRNTELSTGCNSPTKVRVNPNFIDFKPSRTRLWGEKFRLLLNKPTPYIIKDGIRFRPVGVEIL